MTLTNLDAGLALGGLLLAAVILALVWVVRASADDLKWYEQDIAAEDDSGI